MPRLAAAQLGSLHALIFAEIGRRTTANDGPDEIAEAVLEVLDAAEELFGEPLLTYATRTN
ncbi:MULTISPECIES: hypothetical protein [Streptomyces]|uniref:TetR family transcriptional regulator n=1 Tax=Streptomyces ramulosus TaxID=47762 RepID=A0ABW1FDJ5_9ACTN